MIAMIRMCVAFRVWRASRWWFFQARRADRRVHLALPQICAIPFACRRCYRSGAPENLSVMGQGGVASVADADEQWFLVLKSLRSGDAAIGKITRECNASANGGDFSFCSARPRR